MIPGAEVHSESHSEGKIKMDYLDCEKDMKPVVEEELKIYTKYFF